jgi:hypothetical protein
MTKDEHRTVSRMAKLGGIFAKHLALLYINSGPPDKDKIRATWPGIWDLYSDKNKEKEL